MSGRTLAGIALRVWGVVFLVGALTSMPSLITVASAVAQGDQAVRHTQFIAILAIGTRAAVGLFLIVFGGHAAATIVPETEELVVDADVFDMTVLAFGVTGLVIFVWALTDAASVVYTAVAAPAWLAGQSRPAYVWAQQRDAIVRAAVELVAGLVLMLGRDGLATGWWRLRGRDYGEGGQ